MPFGEYLGAVGLALTVGLEDEGEATEGLANLISSRLSPGVGCIYLESVPWEAPWWPDVLWGAQRSPAIDQYGRPWVAQHQLDDPRWTAGDIHWVIDASYLLAEKKMTDETLAVALESVPPFPRVTDMLVRPLRENITPGLLDMVHGFVRALRPAELLVPEAEIDAALLTTVARCETSWIVVPT